MPDVGADRLDYAIRDYFGSIGKETNFGKSVLENISLNNHQIYFTDKDLAREFALKGLEAMWNVIYDPKVAVVYQSIIGIFREGIAAGWLTDNDFLVSDPEMFELIKQNKENIKPLYMQIFSQQFSVVKSLKGQEPDFVHIKLKVRYFDPIVKPAGKLMRLSEIDPLFKTEMDKWVPEFEKRKQGVGYNVIF